MIRKYDFISKHVSKLMSQKMICPVYDKPSNFFHSHLIYFCENWSKTNSSVHGKICVFLF